MELSPKGLELLKRAEGFRRTVYFDIAGIPTIGYGHKMLATDHYPNGLTEAQAELLLQHDVLAAEGAIARYVKVPLSQGQFDALVDFVFNLGAGRLASSTLLTYLNGDLYGLAAQQLLQWDHGRVNGHEVEIAALKARREAEFNLWNGEAA
jgi:lysozyme